MNDLDCSLRMRGGKATQINGARGNSYDVHYAVPRQICRCPWTLSLGSLSQLLKVQYPSKHISSSCVDLFQQTQAMARQTRSWSPVRRYSVGCLALVNHAAAHMTKRL